MEKGFLNVKIVKLRPPYMRHRYVYQIFSPVSRKKNIHILNALINFPVIKSQVPLAYLISSTNSLTSKKLQKVQFQISSRLILEFKPKRVQPCINYEENNTE